MFNRSKTIWQTFQWNRQIFTNSNKIFQAVSKLPMATKQVCSYGGFWLVKSRNSADTNRAAAATVGKITSAVLFRTLWRDVFLMSKHSKYIYLSRKTIVVIFTSYIFKFVSRALINFSAHGRIQMRKYNSLQTVFSEINQTTIITRWTLWFYNKIFCVIYTLINLRIVFI